MNIDRYNRGRPFLTVNFTHRPKAKVNTCEKGWGDDPDNWQTLENVVLVDRVKNNDQSEVIIDIVQSSVIRNRTNRSDDEIVGHYFSRYADDIKDVLAIWAKNTVAAEMISELETQSDAAAAD